MKTTLRRFRPSLLAAAVAAVLIPGCADSADELDLGDEELLLAERCEPDRETDAEVECIRTRDGRAHVRVARDVRADTDDVCARLRLSDRHILRRVADRCLLVGEVGRDSLDCSNVLCADGTACVDSRFGPPVCERQPVRACHIDRDCADTDLCVDRFCARLPLRQDSARSDRPARDAVRGADRASDRRVSDRASDRPSDRIRDGVRDGHRDRITDRRHRDRASDRVTDRRHHDRATDRARDRLSDRR